MNLYIYSHILGVYMKLIAFFKVKLELTTATQRIFVHLTMVINHEHSTLHYT